MAYRSLRYGAIATLICAHLTTWSGSLVLAKGRLNSQELLKLGTLLPSKIAKHAWVSRDLTVRGVYGATRLSRSGRVINTGTLTQTSVGHFSYQPSPNDRLVIVLLNERHEIKVLGAKGNMQARTPGAFLNSNYDLKYSYSVPRKIEFEIRTNRIGLGFAASFKGWIIHDTKRFDFNLIAKGGNIFENSQRAGTESRTQYNLTGIITGASVKMEVKEAHFFHLVSHRRDTVTHSIDKIASTLRTGRDNYKWTDVNVAKVFRTYGSRIRPVFDAQRRWNVTGRVLKNNKVFGSYKMKIERLGVTGRREYQGNIVIVINTPNGPIELQRFRGR